MVILRAVYTFINGCHRADEVRVGGDGAMSWLPGSLHHHASISSKSSLVETLGNYFLIKDIENNYKQHDHTFVLSCETLFLSPFPPVLFPFYPSLSLWHLLHSFNRLPLSLSFVRLLFFSLQKEARYPGLHSLSSQSVMSFIYGAVFPSFQYFMLPWLSLLSLSLTTPYISNINTSLSRTYPYICLQLHMLVLLTESVLFLKSSVFFILILKQTIGVSSCSMMLSVLFFLSLHYWFIFSLILHWFAGWKVYLWYYKCFRVPVFLVLCFIPFCVFLYQCFLVTKHKKYINNSKLAD